MKFQDYYETLGVARTATAEELKQGFRKLARLHHPDVAQDKLAGEAKFKEINEAYEVLGDPAKRQRYDTLGADWQEERGVDATNAAPNRNGTQWRTGSRSAGPDVEFSGTGFSDFFESYFAGQRGEFAGRNQTDTRGFGERAGFSFPGPDIEADLLVTLAEALYGASRKITLQRSEEAGEAVRTDTYQVKIPAGVREGKRIRLTGQGGPGYGGAAAGDLYLRVRLARHPDFTVRDADLHMELEVAPWDAVLGLQAKIATLDGRMSLRVPPGTQPGHDLRMRGLGLRRDDGTRGNLYVTVKVRTPHPVSTAERALWMQLAQASPSNPGPHV